MLFGYCGARLVQGGFLEALVERLGRAFSPNHSNTMSAFAGATDAPNTARTEPQSPALSTSNDNQEAKRLAAARDLCRQLAEDDGDEEEKVDEELSGGSLQQPANALDTWAVGSGAGDGENATAKFTLCTGASWTDVQSGVRPLGAIFGDGRAIV